MGDSAIAPTIVQSPPAPPNAAVGLTAGKDESRLPEWGAVAGELTLRATRWEVVEALAEPFAMVAALVHRLLPGARLM